MERMQLKVWIKRARLVPGNLGSSLLFGGEMMEFQLSYFKSERMMM